MSVRERERGRENRREEERRGDLVSGFKHVKLEMPFRYPSADIQWAARLMSLEVGNRLSASNICNHETKCYHQDNKHRQKSEDVYGLIPGTLQN